MFHSATLKLTGWYLLILMSISLLFSFTIYQTVTGEVRARLSEFQSRFEQPDISLFGSTNNQAFSTYRLLQRQVTSHNILVTLTYVNLLIFFGGGALSYLLARRTLRQIEQSHDAHSRFTSDASHELRTPLAAIKTELEVALNDPKLSKADMRSLLKSNLEEVDKLTVLSKTLLQLSKMDYAGLELEPVNLGDITSEVVQRYDKNAKRIKLSLPPEQLVVKANQASVEELLTILIDNALKYSPPNSRIKASLTKRGRHALFTISNKGEGIAAENLPHIFDRFYRANESRNDGGSGLGLALAKEIVALHKGELTVSSAKNADTTFRFLLPLVRKNQA